MASTTIPGTSKDLLARMQAAWPAFRIAAGALTAAQLDQRTASGWTFREMLGHVAAWHESAARRIAAYRVTGKTETDPKVSRGLFEHLGLASADREALAEKWDMDRFNAAVAAASAGKDRHTILAALDESLGRLRAAVTALTDEQVSADVAEGRPFVVAVVAGDSYEHYPEHQPELAGALPVTGAALAARIEEDWIPFRDRVRGLGRAGLARKTRTGWSLKDLLAHVDGWLEDVPRRIEAIRSGTHKPIASKQAIDEYNARSVASHTLVGPEAMLDELDTCYRRMREAVLGLGDAEARDFKVLGMICARTFLHWEEHAAELEEAAA